VTRLMRPTSSLLAVILLVACASRSEPSTTPGHRDPLPYADPALNLTAASVRYEPVTDALHFRVEVEGDAGSVVPTPVGGVDGAPVLGYVFPTTLAPSRVGFGDVAGTLALAVTSHPDFDDTPLWDEDGNEAYDDDGAVYHAHWVVLGADDRAPAGLAALQRTPSSVLPPTAPMPMYLDSPGFTVIESGRTLEVVVPLDRVTRETGFEVGALTAYMEVDASGDLPLLAVHGVYSQLDDGATSLTVTNASAAPSSAWPALNGDDQSLDVTGASAEYLPSADSVVFTQRVEGRAATLAPTPAGSIDGAPVLGYVFPTSIPAATVGFADTDGILVLAVTSHPDFDDTPLWDENLDRDYANDGMVYHVHWAVLEEDPGSAGGFSVPSQTDASKLPPTAPMPMYLDSPGYHAFASGDSVHVVVPAWHLDDPIGFSFDALTARMRVDASGAAPVLRVEEVVDVLSGDLSLPYTPTTRVE